MKERKLTWDEIRNHPLNPDQILKTMDELYGVSKQEMEILNDKDKDEREDT